MNFKTVRRRYYRRKKTIAKSEQPFFSESSSAIQTKEEKKLFFQTKEEGLKVSQPGDKYEQEADAMADAVMNNSAQATAVQRKEISGIQRVAEEEEGVQAKIQSQVQEEEPALQTQPTEEEEAVQMRAEEEEVQTQAEEEEEIQMQTEEEEEVQMQAEEEEEVQMQTEEEEEVSTSLQTKANGSTQASPILSDQIKQSNGNGQPLPTKTKEKMEGSFGVDFSHVSVHTNSKAVQMNKELHSHAFTHGSDVYFNSGKYQPESSSGQHLLAHELTHVVQQNHQLTNGVQRACLPAATCPAEIPGSAESFGAAEEAVEVGPRGRRRGMACARATSTGHAGHARQLERILIAADPSLFARIHGVFIDADMSRGTGAMTADCANWAADALPPGCDPPGIAGASKPCVLVHGDLNREAYKFNTTTHASIGGMPREDWRVSTIQTLIHEAQHVVFDTSGRPEPPGVSGSCPRSAIFSELSELNAIMSEFPTVLRAIPSSGPGRTHALNRLENWFINAVSNPFESLAGTIRAMRCECDCSEVNAHIQDIFNLVSSSWTPSEKTAFNTELRKARWDTATIDLRWPL